MKGRELCHGLGKAVPEQGMTKAWRKEQAKSSSNKRSNSCNCLKRVQWLVSRVIIMLSEICGDKDLKFAI